MWGSADDQPDGYRTWVTRRGPARHDSYRREGLLQLHRARTVRRHRGDYGVELALLPLGVHAYTSDPRGNPDEFKQSELAPIPLTGYAELAADTVFLPGALNNVTPRTDRSYPRISPDYERLERDGRRGFGSIQISLISDEAVSTSPPGYRVSNGPIAAGRRYRRAPARPSSRPPTPRLASAPARRDPRWARIR